MEFERDQRRRGLSPATIRRRRRVLNAFEADLGRSALTATTEEVETWLDSRQLTARSRGTYLSQLGAFYRFAARAGLIALDPTRDVPRPRSGRLLPRPISDADLALALQCAEPRMRAWLTLAAYGGLRCKEIAGVRREDVLETHDPALLIVSDGKGDDQRVLPLAMESEMALLAYGMPSSGYVFRLNDGRPLCAETVSSYINRYLHGIGIAASAHMCRHFFGSRVYQQTLDLRATQEYMGHRDPRVTSQYAAWSGGRAAAVVRGLSVTNDHVPASVPPAADKEAE